MADKKDKKWSEAREKLEKLEKVESEFGGFFGGLIRGVKGLVDLAERTEKAGGTLRHEREFQGKTKENRPFRGICGFTVSTGLGQKQSKLETFGNIKKTKEGLKVTETREPVVDMFDEKTHVTLIVELPGVQEKDIELEFTKGVLRLNTTGEKKYAKEITLPANIDFASKKMSFKNGILELKFNK
ncbi:MAG: Hsp20/alpha crystallin family protein [Patescibacteria group bacterium]